jgi:prepilin signal peptidase PulO-like enzyme (type II secretory pathway)
VRSSAPTTNGPSGFSRALSSHAHSAAAGASPLRLAAIGLAAALAAAAFARFGVEPHAFIAAYVVVVLVALSAIDIERRVIPNRIVLSSAAIVLAAQVAFYPGQAAEWVLAGFGAAFVMSLPGFFAPGSIGMGDAKLCLLIGAALGKGVAAAIMLGFVASLPVALALVAMRGAAARKEHIPLGPFLAFGALVVLFASGA